MSDEAGFFHPDAGYWQGVGASDAPITIIVEPERSEVGPDGETVTIPAVTRQSTQVAELLASYPPGTVQVPLKPGADYEWDGEAWAYSPPALSPQEIVEQFRVAIQAHVDATAQTRSYDSGTSLASYVASGNAQWAAEAAAFVAWRDAVWIYSYAELDKVTAVPPQRAVPTIEDFLAELPAIAWPD